MDVVGEFKKNSGSPKIGFIGNGNMCKAILAGILKSKLFDAKDILVSGRDESIEKDAKIKEFGVNTTTDNKYLIRSCKIVFLCTKPNALESVSEQLRSRSASVDYENEVSDTTLVSILAGTSLSTIKEALPMFASYLRAMPNTPLQVGAGCTAITKISGKQNTAALMNAKVVEQIFNQSGIVETVDESKFHAITALSGSGPAYAYIIIEALSDAALKQGLTRDLATKFAAQTLLGASKTLLDTNLNTCVLKNQVTSAGGTTIYGIHELERNGLRNSLFMCIEAATKRSEEMAKK